jgi:DUF4097 and DUF4098 domain-containing protein YvlB
MLKRLATLLLGIGLIGLGMLFFLAPERTFVVQLLMRFWPVFLILAGVVRVAGYMIDRHPRSPVGGMMLTAAGGILLSANLLAHTSLLLILGNYWFWVLLAFIAGRVLKQYTHRNEDGARSNAFSPGAIVVMVLIICCGLLANFAAKKDQAIFNLKIGNLSDLGNYVLGNRLSVEDESPQSFTVLPNSRLFINNANGDIEVSAAPQPQATARLVKRIRVASDEEAKEIAKNIHLQIDSNGANYQFKINSNGVQQEFSVSVIVTLPQDLPAGVEINNALGEVKLIGLQGDHTIRNCERAEITRNLGGVTVENPRGQTQFEQIEGPVNLTNARQGVSLRSISGPIALEVKGGDVSLEKSSGPVQLQATDAQIEINGIGLANPTTGNQRTIHIEHARNTRINLQEIKGAVAINANGSRIDADEINGDFTIDSSSNRIRINRINGALQIKSNNGSVEVEEVKGSTTIEATRDVTIRNFRGPLSVTSRQGMISLATTEKLSADVKATNDRGKIRLSIPEDVGFRLDANTGAGKVKVRGFERIVWSREEKSLASGYNISASAPQISLHSGTGEIQLQSSGLAMASQDEND